MRLGRVEKYEMHPEDSSGNFMWDFYADIITKF